MKTLSVISGLLFALIANLISLSACAENKILTITDYHQTFIPFQNKNGELRLAIRMYYIDATPYFLLVNPYSLTTEIAPAAHLKPRKILPDQDEPGYFNMREIESTPYMRTVLKYTASPYLFQNHGALHADKFVNGAFLTIDMCPSVKYFEQAFFNTLVKKARRQRHPIPIALSIAGLWLLGHPLEFNWLLQQEKSNNLSITWMNHSFSHLYFDDLSFENNFLLIPQTNIEHEILETEQLLLQRGVLPSVFFRFPGLVANKEWILTLRKFGLIPVGSHAWLGKHESAEAGSIILVHGNANEPEGVETMMSLLQWPNLQLLPLRSLFIPER